MEERQYTVKLSTVNKIVQPTRLYVDGGRFVPICRVLQSLKDSVQVLEMKSSVRTYDQAVMCVYKVEARKGVVSEPLRSSSMIS